jgi:hypothetical protein
MTDWVWAEARRNSASQAKDSLTGMAREPARRATASPSVDGEVGHQIE